MTPEAGRGRTPPPGGVVRMLLGRVRQPGRGATAAPPAAGPEAVGPEAAAEPPTPPAGNWTPAELAELFGALTAVADLHRPEFLDQVLAFAGRQLDDAAGTPLPVAYHAHPRSRIWALVEAVDRHRDPDAALRALADALAGLRGDEAAVAALVDVAARLAPPGRLPGPRLRAVLRDLDGMRARVPVSAADQSLRRAVRPGESAALRGTETVAQMVLRLSDARSPAPGDQDGGAADPADADPLVLRFLAELAAALPAEAGDVLRGHVARIAEELGIEGATREALAHRGQPGADRPEEAPEAAPDSRVLQIRLRETAPGKHEYALDGTLYDRTAAGLARPRRRAVGSPVALRQLRDVGRTCLVDWADLAARLDDADQVRVEFLLPWSLLDHPVERWLTDGHAYLVGHKYPVVVRSLDRLEQPAWHRDWAHRWRSLHRTGPAAARQGIGWLSLEAAPPSFAPHGGVLHLRGRDGEVRAWLDRNPGTHGLGLAFAYDAANPRRALGLREAICEGVPVAVWRRDDGDPAELAHRLAELADLPDDFAVLPARLRIWRRAAARDDATDMDNQLTLLWDDPECVFRETPLAAPTAEASRR